jgi:hypothetical protein
MPKMPCLEFRPDHNGECLNCDEWADAHELAETVTRAIAQLIYERRVGADWHLSHVDPGVDPFYLTLAREHIASVEPARDAVILPTPPTDDDQ